MGSSLTIGSRGNTSYGFFLWRAIQKVFAVRHKALRAGSRTTSHIVKIITDNRFVSRRNVLKSNIPFEYGNFDFNKWYAPAIEVRASPQSQRSIDSYSRHAQTQDDGATHTSPTHGAHHNHTTPTTHRPTNTTHHQHDQQPTPSHIKHARHISHKKAWQLSNCWEGGAGSSDGKKRLPRFLIRGFY